MRPLPAIAACMIAAPVAHAELSRNLTAAYADTRLAMQNGAGSIVCLGDSLTFQWFGLHRRLSELVNARYGSGGGGYEGCATGGRTTLFGDPNLWQFGVVGNDRPPFHALDGLWASCSTSNAGYLTLTVPDPTIQFFYCAGPEYGSFVVRYPDGAFERVYASATTHEVRTLWHSFPQGQPRSLRIEPSSGLMVALGADSFSQSPGPRLHRVANGGWRVNNFLARNWTFDEQLRAMSPSLFLIMLGQNEAGETQATYAVKLHALADRLQAAAPGAEIILISSYNSGGAWLSGTAAAMEQVAVERSLGYIDVYHAGGTHDFWLASNFIRPPPDSIHFTDAGSEYLARLVFGALESGGASLVPCADIDFNNDGLFPDTADIDALLSVFSGGPCPSDDGWCDAIDFNRDGLFPDTADIDTFLNVFSGGTCGG